LFISFSCIVVVRADRNRKSNKKQWFFGNKKMPFYTADVKKSQIWDYLRNKKYV